MTSREVPLPGADWEEIEQYALELQLRERPSPEKGGEIADRLRRDFDARQVVHESLIVLRAALFHEQRSWHHQNCRPDGQSMQFIRALVAAISVETGAAHRER